MLHGKLCAKVECLQLVLFKSMNKSIHVHIQKTHTLATKLRRIAISAGRCVFQHLAGRRSETVGCLWEVLPEEIFGWYTSCCFRVSLLIFHIAPEGIEGWKTPSAATTTPISRPKAHRMWPAPLRSVLPKALAISIQNMFSHANEAATRIQTHTHTHTLPFICTHNHTSFRPDWVNHEL